MRFLFVSALALLASCGHKDEIDPEFHPYVNSFMTMCRETSNDCKMYNFSIEFVDDVEGDAIGLCSVTFTLANKINQKITIERNYKDSSMLETLIYHEANHCLRFQHHTEGDAPAIMRSYMMNEVEFALKPWKVWVNEMFARNVRYM
jgi:hypothetical protein